MLRGALRSLIASAVPGSCPRSPTVANRCTKKNTLNAITGIKPDYLAARVHPSDYGRLPGQAQPVKPAETNFFRDDLDHRTEQRESGPCPLVEERDFARRSVFQQCNFLWSVP